MLKRSKETHRRTRTGADRHAQARYAHAGRHTRTQAGTHAHAGAHTHTRGRARGRARDSLWMIPTDIFLVFLEIGAVLGVVGDNCRM